MIPRLVYTTPEGIYIVTGCSHSGICNIVEHAKRVTGDSRVLGIIGGFHLFKLGETVDQTISILKTDDIESLLPCHCTSFRVERPSIRKFLLSGKLASV